MIRIHSMFHCGNKTNCVKKLLVEHLELIGDKLDEVECSCFQLVELLPSGFCRIVIQTGLCTCPW